MATTKRFHYTLSCVEADYDAIHDMIRTAEDVSIRTLANNVVGLAEWARNRGYDGLFRSKRGLALAKDWSVNFRRSHYNGVPCYYVRQSGIEWIWTLDGRGR